MTNLDHVLGVALAAPSDMLSDVTSWHAHIPFARVIVEQVKPDTIVELGVHKGDSYFAFAESIKAHKLASRIYGVDTWAGDEHAGFYNGDSVFKSVKDRNRRFAHFSTLIKSTFDKAVEKFEDHSVDLLHIDGLHTYEAVSHDFETWEKKLSASAIVLFHDTIVETDGFEVFKFWSEVSKRYRSFEFKYGNGLGVLFYGKRQKKAALELHELLKEAGTDNEVPPSELFRAVGEAYAGRAVQKFAAARLAKLEAERDKLQQISIREFERLNTEIKEIRAKGQSAIDAVEKELEYTKDVASKEIERLNTENTNIRTEAQARLDRYESETARLNNSISVYRDAATAAPLFADMADRLSHMRENLEGQHQQERKLLSALARKTTSMIAHENALAARVEFVASELEKLRELNSEKNQHLVTLQRQLDTIEAHQSQRLDTLDARQSQIIGILERKRQTRIGRTAGRALRKSKSMVLDTTRIVGRTAINVLPVSDKTKIRVKYRLINRFGGMFGLGNRMRAYDTTNSSQAAIHIISERYLDLARSATGRPAKLPERSVSIIIPVYNQLAYTLRCLESLNRNLDGIDCEIIVVDDHSGDETPFVLSEREDIVYLRNPENRGFIESCNAGLARATKNYVLFLNNDTEVTPGWLSSLVNTFELHPNVGLVGSKLIYPNGQLQEAGGIVWNDFSGWNWGRLKDPEDPRYNYVRHADYCSGASIILPRGLCNFLGGFDTRLKPAYGEDSDLAFKVRSLGLSVLYQPLSQVIHYEGISSGTDVTQGVKAYQVVNAQKLAERWAPVLDHQGEHGVDSEIVSDRARIGRILVIDQITPEPDRDAGSITALELMRALRDFGYKITFIPCSNFTYIPDYTDTLGALGIESVLYPWCKSVEDHLKQFGAHYDAVVIFRFNSAADHIDTVRKCAPRAKIIYHTSDLHFLRESRASKVDNVAIPERRRTAKKTKALELSLTRRADITVLHSTYEKELLESLVPQKPAVVFPWIYEPRGEGKPFAERKNLVFLGGYRHYPNVDAALHFIKDILPELAARRPDLIFSAIGSNPPQELIDCDGANVTVAGFVDDISPLLFGARVMVAPLRYGAGLKGKIVTSMAHGLPVVTTSIGAEGMGLENELNVLVADDPTSFASAVERLYGDEALWNRLRTAGLDYVAQTTSRAAGYRIVADILDKTGLPKLPVDITIEPNGGDSNFGTPLPLLSASRLLEAVGVSGGKATAIVPPEFGSLPDGWIQAGPARVSDLVVLVDSTDAKRTREVISTLPDRVLPGGSAQLVFVPPRLRMDANGLFEVFGPFGQKIIPGQTQWKPLHEAWSEVLLGLGGKTAWRAVTGVTGFPGLMVAEWTAA